MAAALGGVCVEKHYTLDKRLGGSPDHGISVDPPELAEMVRACERAAVLRGASWIGVRDSELPARANARRSVVLVRAVAAGRELQREDLGFRRPGTGIPPFEVDRVVGRRARRNLAEGTVLSDSDVE
jgi:sialic acid synthase SpsE